jgi:transcriptional regulator GlxA family with amidase domain
MAFVTVRRDHASRPDTLIVPGGNGVRDAVRDPDLVTLVAELGRASRRVASVCSGAFLTAAAGLANGRRVTTHWARADALQRAHPEITVDADPIYIRDGDLWSSAGVTAGIDLALAMVEDDHDAQVAQIVARWLVMFLRRPGGQSQFATPVWSDAAATPPIRAAQVLNDTDPGADHRVAQLADRVAMSERHIPRRFADETGISPAQYVARVRLEAARRSLEATDDKVDAIATRCGFGTAETMRRTFTRRLGVSPDQYRRRFRSTP